MAYNFDLVVACITQVMAHGSGGESWMLGHVPAAVAAHLAPLIDWSTAHVHVELCQASTLAGPTGVCLRAFVASSIYLAGKC